MRICCEYKTHVGRKNVPRACGWTLNRTKKVLKLFQAHAHEHTQRMRMAYNTHAHLRRPTHALRIRNANAQGIRQKYFMGIPHFSKNVPCECASTLNRPKKVLKAYEANAHEHMQRMRMRMAIVDDRPSLHFRYKNCIFQ